MKADIETAVKRIGQTAWITRGVCQTKVTLESCRLVYGRIEYLVRAGDRTEWVRESSITWSEPQPLTT